MSAKKFSPKVPANTFRWLLMVLGIALVVWQFFTFMDVVQMHTAQAENISRSASWSGQPVGTTPQIPQSVEVRRVGHNPESVVETGMMHAITP